MPHVQGLVSDEAHRALRVRAATEGCSLTALVSQLLEEAARDELRR